MSDVAAFSLMLIAAAQPRDWIILLLILSFLGLSILSLAIYRRWRQAEDEVLYLRARISFFKGVPNDRFL